MATTDVERIVSRYRVDLGATPSLVRMAEIQLEELRWRTEQLDNKAMGMLGFSGAILALLVSAVPNLPQSTAGAPAKVLVCIAGALAAWAAFKAHGAMRLRDYQWFSDADWFPEDILLPPTDAPEQTVPANEVIDRAFLRDSHRIVVGANAENVRKARGVEGAQNYLLAASFSSLVALVIGLLT